MIGRAAAVGLYAGLTLAAGPGLTAENQTPGFRDIVITSTPIETFSIREAGNRVGELEFLGGLSLDSGDADFGALSGIDFRADGVSLVAVSDTGSWFVGHLMEDNGRPIGIEAAQLAPMLGPGGAPLGDKEAADAEAIRLVDGPDGPVALVSFEQTNLLRRYPAEPNLGFARPVDIKLPASFGRLSRNRGLEAVAVAPKDGPLAGATVVIAERSLDSAGNHRAYILGGPQEGAFSIRRTDRFDITDADFLPNGELIVLERRFGLGQGIAMRLRRFLATDLVPGRLVDGLTVAFADLTSQIDNMEGLAVTTTPSGETVLTLVSDNNQIFLQRTLLLRFIWRAQVPPPPRPRPAAAGSGALPPDTGRAGSAPG